MAESKRMSESKVSKQVYDKIVALCAAYVEEKKPVLHYDGELLQIAIETVEKVSTSPHARGWQQPGNSQKMERRFVYAIISILQEFFPTSEFNFRRRFGGQHSDSCVTGSIEYKLSKADLVLNKEFIDECHRFSKEKASKLVDMTREIGTLRDKITALEYESVLGWYNVTDEYDED
jgi:hypothetical protein